MNRIKGKSKLPEAPEKWVCTECREIVEPLLAPSPFDEKDEICGCPVCHSINSIVAACWKCDREAGGGYNNSTEYRYVWSCHEHRPQQ